MTTVTTYIRSTKGTINHFSYPQIENLDELSTCDSTEVLTMVNRALRWRAMYMGRIDLEKKEYSLKELVEEYQGSIQ